MTVSVVTGGLNNRLVVNAWMDGWMDIERRSNKYTVTTSVLLNLHIVHCPSVCCCALVVGTFVTLASQI